MGVLFWLRRVLARLTALIVLIAGLTGLMGEVTAGPAAACGAGGPSADFARSLPQVRPGDSGTYVIALQTNLRRRGHRLTGTGYYGSRTLQAVKTFQRRHHIRPSGIVGPRTWTAFIGRYPLESTWPDAVRNLPDFGVRPGDRDRDGEFRVGRLVDVMFRVTVGESDFERLDSAAESGPGYNPALVLLVQEFQRKNGIRDSGIVGPRTWSAYFRVVSATGSWGC